MSDAVKMARDWLAQTDPTDGHMVADALAKTVIEQAEQIVMLKRDRQMFKEISFPYRLGRSMGVAQLVNPDHDSLFLRFEQLEHMLNATSGGFPSASIQDIKTVVGLIREQVLK